MFGQPQHVTVRALTLAVVLSALLLIAARPAQCQTETVLYNFTPGSDGTDPSSRLTSDGAGNLYGTTYEGGLGVGTVFELSPNGSGGWNETVLYSFAGEPDGARPFYSDLIFDGVGNLYGTTYLGGANEHGVVFELSPVGGSWVETVLYRFGGGTDGAYPVNGLIMDPAGNLYGATNAGGTSGWGTVFELSPSGNGWTEQVIYNIETQRHYSDAGLTMDVAGNIFGVSFSTVFELSPNGKGGWNPAVIHTFTGREDGSYPEGTLVLDKAGSLYGTTARGGAERDNAKNCGTVYKLSPGKNRKWTKKILYSFNCGQKDGRHPYAGIVFDAAGNIYGTTFNGGKYDGPDLIGGTVYELVAPVGKGGYKEKVLWSFHGTDGAGPLSGLILDSAGNLYGTTQDGGSGTSGVVFELTP
jgi:uncharacterized repeat protein (TIGR03803 family)